MSASVAPPRPRTFSRRMAEQRPGVAPRALVPVTTIIFAAILSVFSVIEPVRTAVYFLPFVAIVEMYAKGSGHFSNNPFIALVVFLLFATVSVISLDSLHKEVIFIGCSVLFALIDFRARRVDIAILLCGYAVGFVLTLAASPASLSSLLSGYSVESAKGAAEVSLGLGTGVIALAAYSRGWRWLTIAALVLSVLFGKRIVLLGFIAAIGVDWVFRATRTMDLKVLRAIGAGIIVSILALVGIYSVEIFEWLSKVLALQFGVYISPNALSSGRYEGISALARYVGMDRPHGIEVSTVIGRGIGFTKDNLPLALNTSHLNSQRYGLLHDDWLRIVIDYGWIGIAIVLILAVRVSSWSRLGFLVSVYTAVLFTSDNSLTYFYFWATVVICFRLPDAMPNRQDVVAPRPEVST